MAKERYNSPLQQKIFNGDKLTQLAAQSVGTTPVDTITFDVECSAFKILNTHKQEKLLYSIDGGTNWLTITPFGHEDTLAIARTLKIKAASGTVTYDLQYTEKR